MEVPSGKKIIEKMFGKLNYIEKSNTRNLKSILSGFVNKVNERDVKKMISTMNYEMYKIDKRKKGKNNIDISTGTSVDILESDVFKPCEKKTKKTKKTKKK